MAHIRLYENESLEVGLRRFNKKVQEEGIVKESKERKYFKKPSLKKREKIKASKRKTLVKELKNQKKFNY